jgi:hypothetical protein
MELELFRIHFSLPKPLAVNPCKKKKKKNPVIYRFQVGRVEIAPL